jgi:uncharacterized membrane protein YqjE
MSDSNIPFTEIPAAGRRLVHRVAHIGVNRMELLLVELEEERERIVLALIYALAGAVFGLLAGISLTFLIVILFWEQSHWMAVGILTVVYGITAILITVRLARLRRDWRAFSATLDQLRKDTACLAHLIP